ncbi:(2Fe-2S)-binding protein [Clostridium cadaveris]|nr:(2Fe-2S)-binding protein [Clostridium cadaveris]NWK12685.1 (2Fe-2S)-binding protein [Clostridium cadaveris]
MLDCLVDKVKDENYYICSNEYCDIVYYNSNYSSVFTKKDMKIPIWYKKDASPKYICYCNKVTEEEIINAVINDDAKDIKDIVKLTGAMKNVNCEINNPFGKCCSPHIKATINKALKMK